MAITLPVVEVPGLREAIRKERTLRDQAYAGGNEIVCGIVVRQLSLRTYLFLERAQNGFIIPYKFDDANEILAHALQVLYFSTPEWKEPKVEPYSFWRSFAEGFRTHRFMKRALQKVGSAEDLVTGVREWIDESCMDCPTGGGSGGVPPQIYASYPTDVVDLFAAASLPFSYDEIMDMPLKRLWQHYRVAASRVYDSKLTNPSDELATLRLAKGET